MRFLCHGPRAYLGDIWLSLAREGHEVRVFCEEPEPERSFLGIIEPVADWRDHLAWLGRDGAMVFERLESAPLQERLRDDGVRVIGTSAHGARLEADRAFGQHVLREAGLRVAEALPFPTPEAAGTWLRANPRRCVLKHDEVEVPTFVGEHPRGDDVRWMLASRSKGRVLLMEHLDGVEIGLGGYFDGTRFLRPICLDFEHKRFFPGDLGEMTGEMGTLATYDGAERLFAATLAKVEPTLAAHRHVGYVNLNLIVGADGTPWPLEFTCRFGNPGFAVLAALQRDGWGDLFARMARGGETRFAAEPGWSVAIVLTIPPFPASRPEAPDEDAPVFLTGDIPAGNLHWVDVRRDGADQLYARRRSGHLGIVTAAGGTVEAAQSLAAQRARNVIAPELRWRSDIGTRYLTRDGQRLRALGLIG